MLRTAPAESSPSTRVEHRFVLSAADTSVLARLAAQHQVTLNSVVQALWAVLLCRYNNTGDVVFGSTVSIRPEALAGSANLVGLAINTIPKRVRVNGAAPFSKLLAGVQRDSLESIDHQFYPLQNILAAGGELFDHLLVFENYPIESALTSGGLTADNFALHEATHYRFVATVVPGDELKLQFVADPALYPAEQLAAIETHLRALVAAVSGADRPVDELDIVSPAELARVLSAFNDTATAYPRERTIHELFEEQVRRAPDRPAVSDGDEWVTYAELNARANDLAAVLDQRVGIKPDDFIGVMIDRSAGMITAILAVLKTGGAYVPLSTLTIRRCASGHSSARRSAGRSSRRLNNMASSLKTAPGSTCWTRRSMSDRRANLVPMRTVLPM